MNLKLICVLVIVVGLFSCSKDEVEVDKNYCALGDLWLFNINDSLHANHGLDTMFFDQAEGNYTLKWTASYFNNIELKVRLMPRVNDTVRFKSQYIKSFTGSFKGEPFTYTPLVADSSLVIINKNGNLTVSYGPLEIITTSGKKLFKICRLTMTDTIP